MEKFDAIIVGAGSAGLGCLGMAQKRGWKAVIIDKDEKNIGGDCLNYGCVPSKAMIHIAKQFQGAKKAQSFGLNVTGKADMKSILNYIHKTQATIRAHESADYLRSQNVDLRIGEAQFTGSHTIKVGDQEIYGEKIFICTGSHPRVIPFEGLDQVDFLTNENIFYNLTELPERFLVIGGGPIGCEMAQCMARFGSEVTIINRGDRILGNERPEISEILQDRLSEEGITIHCKWSLKSFSSAHAAVIENRDSGKTMEIPFDRVLLAIGRGLNHSSMNVAAAGIEETDRGRLVIDDYLRTTASHIYAVGDAAGMYQFSHGAEKHVNLLKHNFDHFFDRKHKVHDLSWVTFTDPEIATFGYSESYLQDQGINYWRQDQDFGHDDRGITSDYAYGRMSLYTTRGKDKRKRKILGGTIIAPYAGEIMQELHLAITTDLCLGDFLDKVYAYPTASRINQQTIMGIVNYEGE